MNINPLVQDRKTNCGQTAVAMLTGKTIREVERIYGEVNLQSRPYGGSTTPSMTHRAVLACGCYAEGFKKYNKGDKLPEVALVRIAWLKRSGGHLSTNGKTKRNGHLVLWANGWFYDPSGHIYKPEQMQGGAVIDQVMEVLVP